MGWDSMLVSRASFRLHMHRYQQMFRKLGSLDRVNIPDPADKGLIAGYHGCKECKSAMAQVLGAIDTSFG